VIQIPNRLIYALLLSTTRFSFHHRIQSELARHHVAPLASASPVLHRGGISPCLRLYQSAMLNTQARIEPVHGPRRI